MTTDFKYKDKTKGELIKELQKLLQEYDSLKTSYEKEISECKLVESALLESNERYQMLFENSGEALLLTNPDGSIYSANPEACRIFGMSEDEICKLGRSGVVDLDDPHLEPGLKERKKTGKFKGELNLLRKDGNNFPAEVSSTVFKDASGNERTSMIIRDISERKRAIEALRLEKENFRHSLDDSPLGVRIATIEGNTIYANRALLNFYGYDSLEELQKTPLKDRYTPESFLQAQKRKHQREHGDLSATEYEISIVRKNREIRHLQVYRKEVLWDGVSQFQVICNDITRRKLTEAALKESETRFRQLFENSLMGISIAGPDGRLIQTNLAYAQMYGYKNQEEMLAYVTNIQELYANPENRLEVLRILNEKGIMEPREVEVLRRDGSRFFILAGIQEIRDVSGKLLYNQATHIDITKRKLTEEEIRKSKELLEILNQHLIEIRENERAAISREIHDELGQSMTALKLDLNQMHKYVINNPEAVMKLGSMIKLISNTIKNMQRISSDLRPGILDDLGLVSAFEWYCDEFEKRTGIKCFLELDNSDYNDSQINLTLFRILQETLTNVIRHARASAVNIRLHQSHKGITMTVNDNGIGIPEGKIESYKSLGLISMRERVRQFNGKIDISSNKDEGTKLTIFIPS